MQGKYDAIVIGSGLGGLTAGAKLCREGRKVLVIEQHDRPGGYATTFNRGDLTMEVGLHEMYGPSPGDMTTRIFNDLEVFRRVEFVPLPEFYHFVHNNTEITLPHDPVLAAERLNALFPGESEGIRSYFEQLMKPKKKVLEEGQQDISIGTFLDSIIRDEELKLILLGNLGYYHDDPYSLSLSYYSISQGSYYSGGASFIKGGSQKLSDHLARYISEHGGEVLLNRLVTGITTEGHRVKGVTYKRRGRSPETLMEAQADIVIANAAMPAVADLLPHDYAHELKKALNGQQTGASLLTLYLGFARPVRELGFGFYSTFVFDSSISCQKDIAVNNRDDFSRRSFTFVDYGQVGSALAPAGKDVGTVCCIDYLSDWERIDRKDYLSKKSYVAEVFIQRLDRLIPGIRRIISHKEVATPLTLRRYTLNPGGAVYGFAQNPSRKAIDLSALPDNLYFASAWGATGGGFSGAIYGGYLCALQVLRKRA